MDNLHAFDRHADRSFTQSPQPLPPPNIARPHSQSLPTTQESRVSEIPTAVNQAFMINSGSSEAPVPVIKRYMFFVGCTS